MSSEFDSGECDVCGGPQQWTIYAGVTFVRCTVCLPAQLVMEGFDLPSDSEDPGYGFARSVEGLEPEERSGVESPEGGDAVVNETKDYDLPF